MDGISALTDLVMAHKAPFDLSFWKPNHEHTVIDTVMDLPLDRAKFKSMKLPYLAADHGFVNPFPHRALFDVLTMFKIASQYDLDEILKLARSPRIIIRAVVSFDEKQKAKDAGFYLDGASKSWLLEAKQAAFEKMRFNFKTEVRRA